MTRLTRAATAVAMVVAMTTGGVGVAALAATSTASAAQHYTVVATNPKSGARIVVPLGDKLLLRLKACETCGYEWKITHKPDPSVIAFDRRLSSTSQCTNGCTGGNAIERFRFSSKGDGTTTVKLGYFPPGKNQPSRVLRLRLTVTS